MLSFIGMRIALSCLLFLFVAYPLESLAQVTPQLLNTSAPAANNAVEIIVEANTYVPDFYQGRAEPTAGSQVRLTAIASAPAQRYSYIWRINGQALPETTQSVTVTPPLTSSEVLVEVRVLDAPGTTISTRSEYIRLSKPKIVFYEDNPLRGMSRVSLFEENALVGNEMTVRGEPYFLGVDSLAFQAEGSWTSGALSNIPYDDWRAVTIFSNDKSGVTEVMLNVRNIQNLADTVSGQFKIKL